MPGWPLPTPACQDPSSFTQRPCSKLLESSPRYQTFPSLSWAYQSNVRSRTVPSWVVAISRTTVAVIPSMTFLSAVTVTIRADRSAPYGMIQFAMQACSEALLYKIEVGAAKPAPR